MTPDERIEALLNRAGQTISDLPSPIDYNIKQEELAMEAAADFGGGLEAYILHLTDTIDRMETALENVCGERDYLLKTQSFDCEDCVNFDSEDCPEMQTDPALRCDSTTAIWNGVSENWSVDDEKSNA